MELLLFESRARRGRGWDCAGTCRDVLGCAGGALPGACRGPAGAGWDGVRGGRERTGRAGNIGCDREQAGRAAGPRRGRGQRRPLGAGGRRWVQDGCRWAQMGARWARLGGSLGGSSAGGLWGPLGVLRSVFGRPGQRWPAAAGCTTRRQYGLGGRVGSWDGLPAPAWPFCRALPSSLHSALCALHAVCVLRVSCVEPACAPQHCSDLSPAGQQRPPRPLANRKQSRRRMAPIMQRGRAGGMQRTCPCNCGKIP